MKLFALFFFELDFEFLELVSLNSLFCMSDLQVAVKLSVYKVHCFHVVSVLGMSHLSQTCWH